MTAPAPQQRTAAALLTGALLAESAIAETATTTLRRTTLTAASAQLAATRFATATTRQHNQIGSAPKLHALAGLLAESAIAATATTTLHRTTR